MTLTKDFYDYIERVSKVAFHKYIHEDCLPLCIVFNRPNGEDECLEIEDEDGNLVQVNNEITVCNN